MTVLRAVSLLLATLTMGLVAAVLAASRRASSEEVVASPSPSLSANRTLAQGRASHPDDDLASGVPCFQVPNRLGGLAQRSRVAIAAAGLAHAGHDRVVSRSWRHDRQAVSKRSWRSIRSWSVRRWPGSGS